MTPSWSSRSPSGGLSRWLCSRGSLTARLQANGRFQVRTLSTTWSKTTVDEARLLGLARPIMVYARQVCLLVDGEPCVVARTVVSGRALRGSWRSVLALGGRPLGAALWANPHVARGGKSYACLRQGDDLHRRLKRFYKNLPARLPARRSCFYLHGQPLLVMEAFLPAMRLLGPGNGCQFVFRLSARPASVRDAVPSAVTA